MSTSPPVFSTFENGVYTITLNRPQRANAFDYGMAKALQAALKNAARDPQIRCVLLTGAGAVFSAGQDLSEVQSVESISYREHLQRTYNPIILQIRHLEKPVLAALKGAVAGAALGIALACDMRIAAQNTLFTVGFLKVGLVPDSAVSLLLPAVIGLGQASELAFMNTPFDAEQALTWGLVNRVVPADDLDALAFQWASELTQGPVGTMGLTKRAFNKAVLPHLEQVLDYEAHLQAIAQHGDEHREGVRAFLEKRKPRFTGA
ncbi:MAG: enoyl-CoA hydratase/isomerase family protein [Chloroflexi bacterium]|nr:enoyl-CoA hydratase/isomerase family protein [Chloroflexota bacterium]